MQGEKKTKDKRDESQRIREAEDKEFILYGFMVSIFGSCKLEIKGIEEKMVLNIYSKSVH